MNNLKIFTVSLLVTSLLCLSVVFYLQRAIVSPGIKSIDSKFSGTTEEIALNFPQDQQIINGPLLSNTGSKAVFLTKNNSDKYSILLWELGIGLRNILENFKDLNKITTVLFPANGKTIFFLGANNTENFLFRWREGLGIEKIKDLALSNDWLLNTTESGNKVLFFPGSSSAKVLTAQNQNPANLNSGFLIEFDKIAEDKNFPLSGLKTSAQSYQILALGLNSSPLTTNFKNQLITTVQAKEEVKDLIIKQIHLKSKVNMLDVNSDGFDDLLAFANDSPFPLWRSYTLDGMDSLSKQEAARKGMSSNFRVGDAKGLPVPADYNGDGVLDLATFSPGNGFDNTETKGQWQIYLAQGQSLKDSAIINPTAMYLTFQLGTTTALPVPADYDADGTTDIAVYDYNSQNWQIALSKMGFDLAKALNNINRYGFNIVWGDKGDLPIKGDYNGDGYADLILYHEAENDLDNSVWKIKLLGPDTGGTREKTKSFGKKGDLPIIADFDCDGKDDLAVFRPSEAAWYFIFKDESQKKINWTLGYEDRAGKDVSSFVGDFDGDGCADLGLFEPNAKLHQWHVIFSGVKDNARSLFAGSWNMLTHLNFTDEKYLPTQTALWNFYKSVQEREKKHQ